MDELNARHYQIIHISDGSLHEKSGFQHLHAKKISYFGPQSKSNTAPKLRHAIMLYSPKYGWYIQRTGQDSRGAFVEIYSQKQGSVIVRWSSWRIMWASALFANTAQWANVSKIMHGKDLDIRINNIVFIDSGVAEAFPQLEQQVNDYISRMPGFDSRGTIIQEGGEISKRDANTLQAAWDAIEEAGIDRHSYILCIGGGAYLDVIGLAAATAHRGIRFVRFPTTCLSQDDSGVGVKNGINAYGKKNFLGTFAVPYAVVNDFSFLHGQPETERRAGLIEAVKVALVKDASYFHWIEDNAEQLSALNIHILEEAVERSALLHAQHIAYGGDPYETGNSRPLDFGHWAAHKMEQLTDFQLSHADAVGVGLALDTIYSWKTGRLDEDSAMRIIQVLRTLKLDIWHPALDMKTSNGQRAVYTQMLEECIGWLETSFHTLKA